jgi:hypothetical protein
LLLALTFIFGRVLRSTRWRDRREMPIVTYRMVFEHSARRRSSSSSPARRRMVTGDFALRSGPAIRGDRILRVFRHHRARHRHHPARCGIGVPLGV